VVIVEMYQQTLRNQILMREDPVNSKNLDTINEEDESTNLLTKLDNKQESPEASFMDGMPQEIDQALVEKVYSSDWNERQNAMEQLRDTLKAKKTITEEYSIELFSVLYPNLEDETIPVVKTCVECQHVLLEKCRDVLSFVS